MNEEVKNNEVAVNMNQNNTNEVPAQTTNNNTTGKAKKTLTEEQKAARKAKREENQKKKSEPQIHLEEMERQIRRGITGARKIGECLKKIRDNQWYKASAFSTFASYCKKTFDFTSVHAYRLIAYYEVCKDVLGIDEYTEIPERVIRPLTVLVIKKEEPKEDAKEKDDKNQNRDLKNEYLKEDIKRIWNAEMAKLAEARKNGVKTKDYPDYDTLQKAVDDFLMKQAKAGIPQNNVYIKEIGSIERAKLAETLISKTNTAQELLRCFMEADVTYEAAEYLKLRKECLIRIDKAFRKKEPSEVSDSRSKAKKTAEETAKNAGSTETGDTTQVASDSYYLGGIDSFDELEW